MVEGHRSEEIWQSLVERKPCVSRDTFTILCNELRPYIQRRTTGMRVPISVEKRIAVMLWNLATNVEYRTISSFFGIGLSTVCTIFVETCGVITKKSIKKYVNIPQRDTLKEVAKGLLGVSLRPSEQ